MSLPMPSIKMDPVVMQEMDAPFVQIAQASGGDLRKLMFAFFSFLHRRTDFYCVPHEADVMDGGHHQRTIGFKEGEAEKLLLAAFRQFPLRRMPKQNRSLGADPPGKVTPTKATTSIANIKNDTPSTGSTNSKNSSQDETSQQTTVMSQEIRKSVNEDPMESTRFTDEGLQVPVGNGGATSKFRWTQTLDEVTVILAPPEGIRGKDLSVDIKKLAVSVTLKNTNQNNNHEDDDNVDARSILNGTLHDFIVPSESTWSLEGGVMLLVLQKAKKTWWECAFVGDPKIDTTLVDSRRRIDEYDDSTQGAIRRILFDQRQERLGKPTSDKILRAQGVNPIPPLPPGVEFIDNETLQKFESQRLSEA